MTAKKRQPPGEMFTFLVQLVRLIVTLMQHWD